MSTLTPDAGDPFATPKYALTPDAGDPFAPKSVLTPDAGDPFQKGAAPLPLTAPSSAPVSPSVNSAAGADSTPAPHSMNFWDATKYVLGQTADSLLDQVKLPGDVLMGHKDLSDPRVQQEAQSLGLNLALAGRPMDMGAEAPKGIEAAAPKSVLTPDAGDPFKEPAAPSNVVPLRPKPQAEKPLEASQPQPQPQSQPQPQPVGAGVASPYDLLKDLQEKNKVQDPTFKDHLNEAGNVIKGIVSPQSLEGGETAVGGLRRALGRGHQFAKQGKAALEKFTQQVNTLSPKDQLAMMDYLQTRSAREAQGFEALPEWKPFLDTFRNTMNSVRTKLEGMPEFENAQFQEDYLSQMYKNPNAARKFFSDAAKAGSKGFLKGKKFATYEDAIRAGIEPLTLNPIELGVRYLDNAHRFIEVHDFMQTAKENGDWGLYPPGHQPEGWVEMPKAPHGYNTNYTPYAPEGFATIYNRFRSTGMQGRPGQALDALRSTSNALAGFKFALSAYHLTNMMKTSIQSGLSDALDTAMSGHPFEGLKKAGAAAGKPIASLKEGRRLQNMYLDADSEALKAMPLTRKAMDALVNANFRFVGKGRAADEYRYTQAGSYWDSFKRGALKAEFLSDIKDVKGNPIMKTVPTIAKQVGRALETLSSPMFNTYIPAIKTDAAMSMMQTFFKDNPTATDAEADAYARKVSDIIDNRFGELNQENIFWHNTLKQVAQLGTISWSYTYGTARTVGGAIKDTATAPLRAYRGEKVWTPQMSYPIAQGIVYGTLAAIAQYLHTGSAPQSVRDLIAPRTGGKSIYGGQPEREVFPGDEISVLNFFNQPGESLADKQAFWLQMAEQLGHGQDWRGDPISKSSNNPLQAVEAYGQFIGSQALPIYTSQPRYKGSKITELERFMGMRPANMELTDPQGYARMMKYLGVKADRLKARHDARLKAEQQ